MKRQALRIPTTIKHETISQPTEDTIEESLEYSEPNSPISSTSNSINYTLGENFSLLYAYGKIIPNSDIRN